MVQGKKIESLEISYIKLTNEINKEEPNYKIIASIIESDLDMSYKLLKIVNSYSLSSKVSSIPHAVSLMGISELRKWASLVLIGELSFGKPTEVLRLSILRSKFAELLAEKSSYKPSESDIIPIFLKFALDAEFTLYIIQINSATNAESSLKNWNVATGPRRFSESTGRKDFESLGK